MQIKIPSKKANISENKAVKNVLKALQKENKAKVDASDYSITTEKYFNYPYWVGEVYTSKHRVLFPAKHITFYVVCDALNGEYVVLRGIPKLSDVDCKEKYILPTLTSKEDFCRIIEDARKSRINKQFIFGPPHCEVKAVFLLYIPTINVILRNKGTQSRQSFYVNSYTGEVKVKPEGNDEAVE